MNEANNWWQLYLAREPVSFILFNPLKSKPSVDYFDNGKNTASAGAIADLHIVYCSQYICLYTHRKAKKIQRK